MIEIVRETIEKHRMLECGKLAAAVSGGMDSMALLHVLMELCAEYGVLLCVIHIDHGIRGVRSKEEARFVEQHCKDRKIEFMLMQADVPALAKKRKIGIEHAAREARYALLESAALRMGADRIAVAHHRRDNVETVLMNMIRGSGLRGLRGILPVNGDIIRPMLYVGKEQIEGFCRDECIFYINDESNEDDKFVRNRIRHKLLPNMIMSFGGSVEGSIERLALNSAVDDDYLDNAAEIAFEELARWEYDALAVNIEAFLLCHEAIRHRLVLKSLERFEIFTDIQRKNILDIYDLCWKPSGSMLDIPGGITVHKGYESLYFLRNSATVADTSLPSFGEYSFDWGTLILELCDEIPEDVTLHGKDTQYIDYDKLVGGLSIRMRREGDRFFPLGAPGRKKLKEYFIDRKVERFRRDGIPLLIDDEEIIWILGMDIAEKCRVTDKTKKVARLFYEKSKLGRDLHEGYRKGTIYAGTGGDPYS